MEKDKKKKGLVSRILPTRKLNKREITEQVKKQALAFNAVIELADMVGDMDVFERDYNTAVARCKEAEKNLDGLMEAVSMQEESLSKGEALIRDQEFIVKDIVSKAAGERVELLRQAELDKKGIIDDASIVAVSVIEKAKKDAENAASRVIQLRNTAGVLDSQIAESQEHLDEIRKVIDGYKQSALDDIAKLTE